MSKYEDWDNVKGKVFCSSIDGHADSLDISTIDGETFTAEIDLTEVDEKVTSKDIEFVLDTITKLAPYDKIQIRQIFLGICSSQIHIKLHHNINSRVSGEGKSYLLKTVSDLFPNEILLKFNRISDKALYHQNGVMAVKNEETNEYEDLTSLLDKLVAQKEEVESSIEEENSKQRQDRDKNLIKNYKQQIRDIEEKIKTLQSEAVKIIDLDNKAFIFLDTPDENLFNNLMSILSQDSREQLYLFTDKDSSGKNCISTTKIGKYDTIRGR